MRYRLGLPRIKAITAMVAPRYVARKRIGQHDGHRPHRVAWSLGMAGTRAVWASRALLGHCGQGSERPMQQPDATSQMEKMRRVFSPLYEACGLKILSGAVLVERQRVGSSSDTPGEEHRTGSIRICARSPQAEVQVTISI
jgi:hypothetical protein